MTRPNAVRGSLRSLSSVCATCGLPIAAASGVVTRWSLQVFVGYFLAHGSGRLAMKCTELRAQIPNSKVLGVGPMLPKAPLTGALVRKRRTHKGRKNNDPRDVHPFVITNGMRTAAHPRAALSPHNIQSTMYVPRLSQILRQFHDLVILRGTTGPAPLGGDRYN